MLPQKPWFTRESIDCMGWEGEFQKKGRNQPPIANVCVQIGIGIGPFGHSPTSESWKLPQLGQLWPTQTAQLIFYSKQLQHETDLICIPYIAACNIPKLQLRLIHKWCRTLMADPIDHFQGCCGGSHHGHPGCNRSCHDKVLSAIEPPKFGNWEGRSSKWSTWHLHMCLVHLRSSNPMSHTWMCIST